MNEKIRLLRISACYFRKCNEKAINSMEPMLYSLPAQAYIQFIVSF